MAGVKFDYTGTIYNENYKVIADNINTLLKARAIERERIGNTLPVESQTFYVITREN
jgi:hypothetical protein